MARTDGPGCVSVRFSKGRMWGKVSGYASQAHSMFKSGLAQAQHTYHKGMHLAGQASSVWDTAKKVGGIVAPDAKFGSSFAPALAEGSAVIELAQSRPQGGGERPPRAAMQACSGKSAADACEFTLDDEQVTGTCRSPDAKRPLACVSGHADHSQG